ncbi:putative ABC transporter [Klebsiella pneumoniae]|uniref:Putative ABC transporter n=1 Tax=Klebsiella pneumoniae TaxID=573 RepID=A0A377XAW9_KLEPN|nr:putative ABC transporter [Klebsiella pneumoniae]
MPATHSPTPARSWIVRLARVCWERKKLTIIVVVASVSTILLAALTPLLTRQAVNDALAGNPTRLPRLACGLLLIAFFDFIGNYVRRGYAGELSLWVQHTLRGRAFDSIQKLDGAGQDALRTGQVISRTNSDLQQVHTLLQMCPVPLAVFTYYIAGIAVMLWMSPAMTLIVVCVLACLAITALRARRRVFAQTGLASDRLANLTEHMREVLAQISVVKSCVAELRETRWLDRQSRQIVRVRTFGHMLRLGLPWHEKHVDSRLTRMTVDVDSLARFLQNGLAGAATSLVTMFAIAAAMFWLDPLLALTALSAVPQVALATWIYRRLSSPAYAQARLEIGKVNSTLQEKVSGLRVVQSHGQQEQEAARLRALSDRFRATRVRAQKYLAVYFPFLTFCTEASYAAVLLVGASRVAEGEMTAGVMAAFYLLVGQFYGPVQQLSGIVDAWQQATASGKHIDELLATEGTENVTPSSAPPATGALHLDDVTFSYPDSSEPALTKLTLTIPEGTVVAVVGRSGAGKSTLIKLIAGLYSPTYGSIGIGDRTIDDASLADYRLQIGVVDQDVALFSSDIAENIRYSRPSSTNDDVEIASLRAGLYETVRNLPQGFRTPVNNGGADLSAGQRQLIALARAQLANAHILLLDEATSRLDRASEERLMSSLIDVAHAKKHSALIVAHRLTTAQRCELIAVLDKGQLTEYGTHEQLLAAGGLYNQLWHDSVGSTVLHRQHDIAG